MNKAAYIASYGKQGKNRLTTKDKCTAVEHPKLKHISYLPIIA